MKYKITIEEIIEIDGSKYPDTRTIYEQTTDRLIVQEVVAVVNGLFKSK